MEHIEDLDFLFKEASKVLATNGHIYICELHPYKQYTGSKARFETEKGIEVLECFVHHVSDYFKAASKNNFNCISLQEWFDENENNAPRLLSFLFQKK